jgi:hypothetical protein
MDIVLKACVVYCTRSSLIKGCYVLWKVLQVEAHKILLIEEGNYQHGPIEELRSYYIHEHLTRMLRPSPPTIAVKGPVPAQKQHSKITFLPPPTSSPKNPDK